MDDSSALSLKETAEQLARSAGGVAANLEFKDEVEIVLAGSVWVKASCKVMQETFEELIHTYTKKKCIVKVLQVPPATGAVIWAQELHQGTFPSEELRNKIIQNVEQVLDQIQMKQD